MIKSKLKQLRLQHNNMSQKELIKLSEIRPSTISSLENDSALTISIVQIDKLCSIFQCQPSDLMEYLPESDEPVTNLCGNANIPQLLFDLRKNKSLTETEAAYKLGIDYPTYIKYESGTITVPLNIISKACNLYDVPLNYFGINSNLGAVGNKGYSIKNTKTSETLDVTPEEFEMLKGVLAAYRNK